MKILVTGATSFIGSHIIEELSKQGLALKAAYRPGEEFHRLDSDFLIEGLDLESFPLDLTDRTAVFKALKGCQILFHSDYLLSFKRRDKDRLYQINQMGTRNLMEAAISEGVEKVVYTAGMETLRAPKGREVTTEGDGVTLDDLSTHFERSRFLAEHEILQLKAKGLPAVFVHPTVCLGKREQGTTPFGRYLESYLRGKTYFYLDTGLNLVDVVDVAKGHLLAAKRGEIGERYILGNQNLYLLEILTNLEKLTGRKAPKTALPMRLAKFGNFFGGMLGRKRKIPNPVLSRLQNPLFFDSSRARKELGMPQSNVWEALKRQIQDLLKV